MLNSSYRNAVCRSRLREEKVQPLSEKGLEGAMKHQLVRKRSWKAEAFGKYRGLRIAMAFQYLLSSLNTPWESIDLSEIDDTYFLLIYSFIYSFHLFIGRSSLSEDERVMESLELHSPFNEMWVRYLNLYWSLIIVTFSTLLKYLIGPYFWFRSQSD